jgi:NADPH2:quinone reductase
MRAIVIEKFGGPEGLVFKELPDPEPKPGHVVIQVKAFGINHAEMHMRRGEWAEAAEVSGIECVGLVRSCPGGEFAVGTKVAALMGGMGRSINGSYAEYTRPPAANVAQIESDLPWENLAAIPQSYATAWTYLFRNLELVEGQTLVIRGAMSSFGQAALNLAVNAGAHVGERRRTRHCDSAQARSFSEIGSTWRTPRRNRRPGPVRAHPRPETHRCGSRPSRQQHHPGFPRRDCGGVDARAWRAF